MIKMSKLVVEGVIHEIVDEAAREDIEILKEEVQDINKDIASLDKVTKQLDKDVKSVTGAFGDAIKNKVEGNVIAIDDVSSVKHELKVKVTCPDGVNPTNVNVIRCGKNMYDNDTIADKYVEAVGYKKYKLLLPNGDYTWSLKENTFLNSGCYAIWTDDEIYEGGEQQNNCFYNWIGNSGVERECPINGTFTVTKGYVYLATTGAVNGQITEFIEKFATMQLEKGSLATSFEAFKEMSEHKPSLDGTVEGMTSLSPNMTILTDTEGVVIDCEYNVDTKTYIDKKFAELQALSQ